MRLGMGLVGALCVGLAVSLAVGCDDEDSVKNRTGVDAGNGDGSVSSGGSGGATFGACVACNPEEAILSAQTANLFAAGVSFTTTDTSCAASPTPPAADQLAVDFDFDTMAWTGSGSGYTVESISAGSFFNDPMGFYELTNLPVNTPITLVLVEDGSGTRVSVTFTVSDDVSPILQSVCVAFES
ncbi:MAG: hypothetical protein H6716_08600 [Polyangiaceae bacterium]|nr:hypothetical protein [Polyangiaceae bacterium]